jgi:hypothetical protein
MGVSAFPLQWPDHIERARAREKGRFSTSLSAALQNVEGSLRRFATDSDYSLGDRKPADPGVPVWFVWDSMQVCIPVDRYSSVEANLQAIHHVIEARRTELRHGTLALVRATFKGFQALPAPTPSAKRAWRAILLFSPAMLRPNRDMIEKRYRELAKERHPDARSPEGGRTMTDEVPTDIAALVENLTDTASGCDHMNEFGLRDMCNEAATALRALQAENERLRDMASAALDAPRAEPQTSALRHECAKSGFHDHDGCSCSDAELLQRRATRAEIPEGWKLVPVEPTPEMINAWTYWVRLHGREPPCWEAYKIMLAASPSASTKGGNDGE